MSKPRRMHGFTLIELMMAVIILGILGAIAVPSFQNMMVQNRLAASGNELVAALKLARAEAIKRGQSVSLAVITSGWQVKNASNTVLHSGTLPGNLQISTSLTGNTVTFLATGLSNVAANADSICLLSTTGGGDLARIITIGAGGRTSLKKAGSCS